MKSDSGHGGQTKDTDGDEADGHDEGLFLRLKFYFTLTLTSVQLFIQYNLISTYSYLSLMITLQVDFKQNGHIVDDVSSRCNTHSS
jgi:hypothetical protein